MLWLRGSIGKGGADTAWFQGEYGIVHSLPLMSKGEEKDKRKSMSRKSIAINAKGGDCWKCLTGSICLSLMASIAMKMACIQEECTKDCWHVIQDDRQTKDKAQEIFHRKKPR
jgi:hypothetical protein